MAGSKNGAAADLDRYTLITADTHAGAAPRAYRPYLEKRYHADFDEWVGGFEKGKAETRAMMKAALGDLDDVGVGGDPDTDADRNWNSDRRLREMQEDGVVAEVVFPNTQPPFAPVAASALQAPPLGDDLERRWAGLRAHNRWLADFCAEAPGRRAGVVQIILGDVESTVKEIEWAAEQPYLTGGFLLPGAPPGGPDEPLYSAKYEPIWSAIEASGRPLNHHSGSAVPDFGFHPPASMAIFMLEVTWWAHRALWHLMFSGVFERHPNLHLTMTESGTKWVTDTLENLDYFYERMKYDEQCSEHVFGGLVVATMSHRPSDYFKRQCHIGASFLRPIECENRHKVGVDRIMWGTDYPHTEGSYPFTADHLRLTFAGVPEDEVHQLVAGNAAELYGFDLDLLAPLAAKYGPLKADIATPLPYEQVTDKARKCPAFARQLQREGVVA